MDTDVVVVGAGLAGLQCARRLQESGRSVIVLESAENVGGRVRTDKIDGFLCDKGFQLLNPAYPAVRAWIDMPALNLQKFGTGVVVRSGDQVSTLAHPIRYPEHAIATLRSKHIQLADLVALSRWLGPTLLRTATAPQTQSDEKLRKSFDDVGLTGRLRRDVLDTFLAGVLADSSGNTSANYVRQLMRYFVLGTPGLPQKGMQALPDQMAGELLDPVRTRVSARHIRETAEGVEVTTDNGVIRGRAAVIAVGPQHVAQLAEVPVPETRGLTTWWFRAPGEPQVGPFLMIDASQSGGGPAGPIWHTAVVSEAAPSYAPAGENLVEATTLLDRPDGTATEAQVRRDLERLYKTPTAAWDVVAHHVVPHALPSQPPPLNNVANKWTGKRVLVTGDHRATGSIQGALNAGDRAGRAVASVLGS